MMGGCLSTKAVSVHPFTWSGRETADREGRKRDRVTHHPRLSLLVLEPFQGRSKPDEPPMWPPQCRPPLLICLTSPSSTPRPGSCIGRRRWSASPAKVAPAGPSTSSSNRPSPVLDQHRSCDGGVDCAVVPTQPIALKQAAGSANGRRKREAGERERERERGERIELTATTRTHPRIANAQTTVHTNAITTALR
jgi:hypothetical protein